VLQILGVEYLHNIVWWIH